MAGTHQQGRSGSDRNARDAARLNGTAVPNANPSPSRCMRINTNPQKETEMFGLFNKRVKKAQQNLKNVENRDLMEAIVGGCLLIAAADGEIEKEETDKLDQLLRSNARLQGFGTEISQTIQRFTDQLEAGFQVGRLSIMREIADVADDREHAEEVLVNMITIAGSDGEFEDEEVVVIKEVAGKIGLNPSDYGLPA